MNNVQYGGPLHRFAALDDEVIDTHAVASQPIGISIGDLLRDTEHVNLCGAVESFPNHAVKDSELLIAGPVGEPKLVGAGNIWFVEVYEHP